MAFNDIDLAMGDALVEILGEPVTYTYLSGGSVSTHCEIDLDVEIFGDGSGIAEYRTEISLLVADVGVIHRGDTVLTAGGTTYTINDLLPSLSDKVITRVSAQ